MFILSRYWFSFNFQFNLPGFWRVYHLCLTFWDKTTRGNVCICCLNKKKSKGTGDSFIHFLFNICSFSVSSISISKSKYMSLLWSSLFWHNELNSPMKAPHSRSTPKNILEKINNCKNSTSILVIQTGLWFLLLKSQYKRVCMGFTE